MEKIVQIPENVKIEVNGLKVGINGKEGSLEKDFYNPLFKDKIKLELKNNNLKVSTESEKRKIKSMIGTIAAHVNNMIKGTTRGWTYKLKIIYVHFPITVKVSGDELLINNFSGEHSARHAKIINGTKVEIKGDEITLRGIDIESIGQTAANIEQATHISARDRRVFQDGIFISEKAL